MFCHKHISHVFKCKFAFVYQILYLPKYEPSIIASKKRLNFWTPKSPITAIRVKKWRKQKVKNSEAVFGYFLKKKLFPRFLLLWDVSTIYLGEIYPPLVDFFRLKRLPVIYVADKSINQTSHNSLDSLVLGSPDAILMIGRTLKLLLWPGSSCDPVFHNQLQITNDRIRSLASQASHHQHVSSQICFLLTKITITLQDLSSSPGWRCCCPALLLDALCWHAGTRSSPQRWRGDSKVKMK